MTLVEPEETVQVAASVPRPAEEDRDVPGPVEEVRDVPGPAEAEEVRDVPCCAEEVTDVPGPAKEVRNALKRASVQLRSSNRPRKRRCLD